VHWARWVLILSAGVPVPAAWLPRHRDGRDDSLEWSGSRPREREKSTVTDGLRLILDLVELTGLEPHAFSLQGLDLLHHALIAPRVHCMRCMAAPLLQRRDTPGVRLPRPSRVGPTTAPSTPTCLLIDKFSSQPKPQVNRRDAHRAISLTYVATAVNFPSTSPPPDNDCSHWGYSADSKGRRHDFGGEERLRWSSGRRPWAP